MYLQLDEAFDDHPKTVTLCRLVKDHNGGMYIIRLWRWAMRTCRDGDLTKLQPDDIERIVRWRGRKGVLAQALTVAGFVDETDGRRVLHDWMEWTGRDMAHMESEARRRRVERLHRSGRCSRPGVTAQCPICERERATHGNNNVPEKASAGRPPDISRTSVEDQTRPDQTRSDQIPPTPRKRGNGRAESDDFKAWYEAFPRKQARDDAWKAWQQTEQSRPDLREMLATLEWQRRLDFDRRPPDKVPYPARYLRSGQWKDERPKLGSRPTASRPEHREIGPSSKQLEAEKKRVADSWGKAPVTIDEVWDDGKAWWEKKAKP